MLTFNSAPFSVLTCSHDVNDNPNPTHGDEMEKKFTLKIGKLVIKTNDIFEIEKYQYRLEREAFKKGATPKSHTVNGIPYSWSIDNERWEREATNFLA